MAFKLSVIIPTHQPDYTRLNRVISGLKSQSLSLQAWELLVVNNDTEDAHLSDRFDFSWHPHYKIIHETKLGLTHARIAGIQASQGQYLVFVDDDNVLHDEYLANVIQIFDHHPELGTIGGKTLPEFEIEPEPWMHDFLACLAIRDLGDEIQTYAYPQTPDTLRQHPVFAPIGAGMALRRSATEVYVNTILNNPTRIQFDRTGQCLQSGGDCDINLTVLAAGWTVGYFPQLQLTHLIAKNRLTKNYLARLNYASSRSWIQVLETHHICPWQKIPAWSVLLRKIKSFITYKAWKDQKNYVKWQGACGMFDSLAQ